MLDFEKLKQVLDDYKKFEDNRQLDDVDLTKLFSPFSMIWRLVHRQRAANKVMKMLSEDYGLFSYYNMYMGVANLARVDSLKYEHPETKGVWYGRYLKLKNHLRGTRHD
jgi:hypothetical protein